MKIACKSNYTFLKQFFQRAFALISADGSQGLEIYTNNAGRGASGLVKAPFPVSLTFLGKQEKEPVGCGGGSFDITPLFELNGSGLWEFERLVVKLKGVF